MARFEPAVNKDDDDAVFFAVLLKTFLESSRMFINDYLNIYYYSYSFS